MIPLNPGWNCEIFTLAEMLEDYGPEMVSSVLGSFKPVHDSDTESYLKEKAIDMEVRDLSRTYLAVATDEVKVLGYITISIKCLRVPEENLLSGKARKNMNIDSKTNIVQSYLIGQLSRSIDAPKGLGTYLLDVAVEKLNQARGIVGCKIVRLDCHDELIPYYTSQGFRMIARGDDGSLNQMMTFLDKRAKGYSRRTMTTGASLRPRSDVSAFGHAVSGRMTRPPREPSPGAVRLKTMPFPRRHPVHLGTAT